MTGPLWLEVLLTNAAVATLLALVAAAAARIVRPPAFVHLLWLTVLLKLLTPPLLRIGALPRPAEPLPAPLIDLTKMTSTATAAEPLLAGSAPESLPLAMPEPPTAFSIPDPVTLSVAVWVLGGVVLLGLALVRLHRFRRLLGPSRAPRRALAERVELLASEIGLRTTPRVRLVAGRLSPMVQWTPRGTELLLPEDLLGTLAPRERDTLIAHELAHLRRGDHWVRYLELLVTALFWWHPVVWWARRNLRAAEERSCDAVVLRAYPGCARDYARGLFKTLDFLSDRAPAVPAVATGAVGARQLEERLTMIVEAPPPRRTSVTQRVLLATLGLAALLVFPTWIERAAAGERGDRDPDELEQVERIHELERRAIDLEAQLRQVRLEHRETQAALDLQRAQNDVRHLRQRADELDATGDAGAAERARNEADELERVAALESAMLRDELETSRQAGTLETDLRQVMLEIERLRAAGEDVGADGLEREARQLEQELEMLQVDADGRRADYAASRHAFERERLLRELELAEAEGDEQRAGKIAKALELRAYEEAASQEQRRLELRERELSVEKMAAEKRAVELGDSAAKERLLELRERELALSKERLEREYEVQRELQQRQQAIELEDLERARARERKLHDAMRSDVIGELEAEISKLERWAPTDADGIAYREDRLRELREKLAAMGAR
jgi:beta-lactamase regulating signal transducer with metallopeptidase domain